MLIDRCLKIWLVAFTVHCACDEALAQTPAPSAAEAIRETYPDGVVRLEATVRVDGTGKKVFHGHYVTYFPNGARAEEGDYVDGQRDGKWSSFFSNGKPSASGEYDAGFRVGTWSIYSAPGKIDRSLTGNYKRVEYPLARGMTAVGSLLNGRAADRWIYRRSDGSRLLIANYRDGEFDGDVVLIHADGTVDPEMTTGRYSRGRRIGALPDATLQAIESTPRALSDLAALPISPSLAEEEVARIEKLVADLGSEDDIRYSAAMFALRNPLDRQGMAIVVNAMCKLDLAQDSHHRLAVAFREKVLPRWTAGIAFPAVPMERTTDERLSILRARTLCELALDDSFYFEFDLSLRRIRFDDRSRNPLFDPPLPSLPLKPIAERAPLYALRFPPVKGAKAPPSDKVEPTLGKALEWLVRHQNADGGFSAAYFSERCVGTPCSGSGQLDSETFVTSLAVLALLGDPNPARRESHLIPIRKGLVWLLSHQDPTTGAFGDTASVTDPKTSETLFYASLERPRDSALAVTALCESLVLFDRHLPSVEQAAELGLDWLKRDRIAGAGWTRSREEGRSEAISTGHVLLAIMAARAAGIIVANDLSDEARTVLVDLTDPMSGRTGMFVRGSFSPRLAESLVRFAPELADYCTALTLTVRQLFGEATDRADLQKGFALLATHRPNWTPTAGNIDALAWWFSSLAFALQGGKDRDPWFSSLTQSLAEGQATGGCADGSWDPAADAWGIDSGRAYLTATFALALEAPWRYAR